MRKKIILIILLFVSLISFSQENNPKISEIGLVFSSLNNYGIRYKWGKESGVWRITALVLNTSNITTNYNNYSVDGANFNGIPDRPVSSLGAGFNIGYEQRNWISNKTYFFYGIDLINSYTFNNTNNVIPLESTYNYYDLNDQHITLTSFYDNTSNTKTYTLSSGIGVVLGFAIRFNDLISVAAELVPSVSYKYTYNSTSNVNNTVRWSGNDGVGFTPTYTSSVNSQKSVSKGISFGFSNTGASITIACKLNRNSTKP